MAELTADAIRMIVREEVGSLREEMKAEFKYVRQEMNDGVNQVLATVQSFHDEDQDEIQGIKGRLSNHNQRIAKLERLSKIRA